MEKGGSAGNQNKEKMISLVREAKSEEDSAKMAQARTLWNNNDLHVRKGWYVTHHGEEGQYREDISTAASINAEVTAKLVSMAAAKYKFPGKSGSSVTKGLKGPDTFELPVTRDLDQGKDDFASAGVSRYHDAWVIAELTERLRSSIGGSMFKGGSGSKRNMSSRKAKLPVIWKVWLRNRWRTLYKTTMYSGRELLHKCLSIFRSA